MKTFLLILMLATGTLLALFILMVFFHSLFNLNVPKFLEYTELSDNDYFDDDLVIVLLPAFMLAVFLILLPADILFL